MKRLFLSMVLLTISWPAFAIDLSGVALIPAEKRDALQKTYADLPSPKILVASFTGHYVYIGNNKGNWTTESLRKAALERCEILYDGVCAVVAVDDNLQDDSQGNIVPLRPSGGTDYDAIPTEPPSFKDEHLAAYLASSGHKAIALGGGGAWGTSWDSSQSLAAQIALSNCEKNAKTGQCFLYDLDGEIAQDLRVRLTNKDVILAVADAKPINDCAKHIWVSAGENCKQWNDMRTVGGGLKGLFPYYQISRSSPTENYAITLVRAPVGENCLHALALDDRTSFILRMAGNRGTASEAPAVSGDLTTQRLSINGKSCFGFFRNGALKALGYGWQAFGVFCEQRQSNPLTDAQITNFISSIHIQD